MNEDFGNDCGFCPVCGSDTPQHDCALVLRAENERIEEELRLFQTLMYACFASQCPDLYVPGELTDGLAKLGGGG